MLPEPVSIDKKIQQFLTMKSMKFHLLATRASKLKEILYKQLMKNLEDLWIQYLRLISRLMKKILKLGSLTSQRIPLLSIMVSVKETIPIRPVISEMETITVLLSQNSGLILPVQFLRIPVIDCLLT